MADARGAFERLDDDSLRLVFELVGPAGMADERRLEPLRDSRDLAPAQRDLNRFRALSRRIGAIAGAVAERHLGTREVREYADSQSSITHTRQTSGSRR